MQWQGESVRKVTGGRRRPAADEAESRDRSCTGRHPYRRRPARGSSARSVGMTRFVALRATYANVTNPKNGETKKVKIETVEKNTANPNYVRRNLLTKGAIIKTEIGSARIMSRPGQDGIINALLLE